MEGAELHSGVLCWPVSRFCWIVFIKGVTGRRLIVGESPPLILRHCIWWMFLHQLGCQRSLAVTANKQATSEDSFS